MRKIIKNVDIAKELIISFHQYAMNVIIGRSLPDIRDGLKVVHRRILFSMYKEGLFFNKRFVKCAGIVGEVLKKYHPHGDHSVYEALVRMAQPWQMNFPLVVGQGNFGSRDGDPAAAYRYTEAKLSAFSEELIKELIFNTIKYTQNFDFTREEPSVLPSIVPNLLINGADGIAVAMITKCPPHNLSEIVDVLVLLLQEEYLDNKTVSYKEIFNLLPGPDFPTGGFIINNKEYMDVIQYGKGTITISAKTSIKQINGKKFFIIHEIPYQTSKTNIILKISHLLQNKEIDGILRIVDESNFKYLKIMLELSKKSNILDIQSKLFKKTDLRIQYNVYLLSILNQKPKLLSLKKILNKFIEFRKNLTINKYKFLFNNLSKKLKLSLGLIIAIDNIEKVISIVKTSKTYEFAKNQLYITKFYSKTLHENKIYFFNTTYLYNNQLKRICSNKSFFLSKNQISSILNIKLSSLINLKKPNILADIKKTVLELKHLKVILLSPYYIFKKIKLDFIKIKLKYPRSRKTIIKTFQTTKNHYSKKLYTKKEFLFIVTKCRLIHKFNVDFYKIQNKGGKGKNLFSYLLKSSDVVFSFLSSVNNYVFIFTSNGKVYRVSIINILRNIENKKQTLLNSFANLDANEKIVDCINIRSSMDVSNVNYLIMCTIKGQVKKTLFKSYLKISTRGLIAISLKSGDYVSKSKLVSANSNIIVSTEKGYCIKFNVNSLCEKDRKSVGFKSISLSLYDKVNNLNAIPFNNNMFLLHITSLGYGKKTSVNAYKVQKKNGKGVISLKLSCSLDKAVSVLLIDKEECIFVITNVGRILKILLTCLKLQTRYSKGIKVISLGKNEFIVSCLLIN